MWLVALVLSIAAPLPAAPGQIGFMREGKVWIIGVNGSGERALTGTRFYKIERPITWMPDGQRLLYWNHSKIGWDIWSVSADGKEPTNLTRVQSGGCRSPAPSLDGKHIAFMRDHPEGLYVMDADGGNQRRLTPKGFRDFPPSWSPDGKRLAYTAFEEHKFILYGYDLTSGGDTRLVPGSSPCWSPDGKRLLFEAVRNKSRTLHLISPDGTNEIRLAKGPGHALAPAWSPDGNRVAYFAPRDSKVELRIVTVDRKSDTRLASVEGRWWSAPDWSPDGKRLTFAAGPPLKQVVYIVDDQGRDLRKLATGGACYPVWRPVPKTRSPLRRIPCRASLRAS
jgi:Tol biopolymer transport system component